MDEGKIQGGNTHVYVYVYVLRNVNMDDYVHPPLSGSVITYVCT